VLPQDDRIHRRLMTVHTTPGPGPRSKRRSGVPSSREFRASIWLISAIAASS